MRASQTPARHLTLSSFRQHRILCAVLTPKLIPITIPNMDHKDGQPWKLPNCCFIETTLGYLTTFVNSTLAKKRV